MSLIFSKVKIEYKNESVESLISGSPNKKEDFKNWILFEDFLNKIPKNEKIKVLGTTYVYGEGERNNATPEEIAYLIKRIDMQKSFLNSSCTPIFDFQFSFKV